MGHSTKDVDTETPTVGVSWLGSLQLHVCSVVMKVAKLLGHVAPVQSVDQRALGETFDCLSTAARGLFGLRAPYCLTHGVLQLNPRAFMIGPGAWRIEVELRPAQSSLPVPVGQYFGSLEQ